MQSSLMQRQHDSTQYMVMQALACGTAKTLPKPDPGRQTVFNAQVIEAANILRSKDGITNVSPGPVRYLSGMYTVSMCRFVCEIHFDMLGVPMVLSVRMYEDDDSVSCSAGIVSPGDLLSDLQKAPQGRQEFEL